MSLAVIFSRFPPHALIPLFRSEPVPESEPVPLMSMVFPLMARVAVFPLSSIPLNGPETFTPAPPSPVMVIAAKRSAEGDQDRILSLISRSGLFPRCH